MATQVMAFSEWDRLFTEFVKGLDRHDERAEADDMSRGL
jgi:hypothetical protein